MATMKWSYDMRLIVDMLYDDSAADTNLSSVQRGNAFNAIFKDQLRAFGFTGGVPYTRLRAQYAEKKKQKNADWIQISTPARTQQEQERRRSLQDRLQSVTARSIPTTPSTSKKRKAKVDEGHLPLSKRTAIGVWIPETPQSFAMPIAVVRHPNLPKAPVKIVRPAKVVTPKSPTKRPDGKTVMLPADIVLRRMVPSVSQHRAQPPLPRLLFRLWQADPNSNRDSRNGFWSRRHYNKNALSALPPRATSIDATDILDHMDRRFVDTPFISTTNRPIWLVQQTLTALKSHGNYYVSVIDVDALDKRGVYWARPFHDEVRPSKGFSNGAGNYRGTHEFLVFQKIPKAAIIHTFKASDLVALATNDREISQTLRFETLHPRAALATKIATLRSQKVPLSRSTVSAMAKLVDFFLGSTYKSSIGHISAIISGICEGWGLDIRPRDEQEWQTLANHFATRLNSSFDIRERQTVKLAFLDGVAWGCGEPNAKHTLAGIANKNKKATAVGLGSPSDILSHELDALKLAMKLHEKGEQRVLQRYHSIQPATQPTTQQLRMNAMDDYEDDELAELDRDPERDELDDDVLEDEQNLEPESEKDDIIYDSEDDDDDSIG